MRESVRLTFALSLIYVALSYLVSRGLGGRLTALVAVPLLLVPVPGLIAFFYGARKGGKGESFLLGFFPAFVFFVVGGLFGGFSSFPLFPAIFLGACSGVLGYSGTVKRRGEGEWVVFALIGLLLWFIVRLRVV